ncbi:hypothetical protein NKH77_41020 [Streptomyces sp. M19]
MAEAVAFLASDAAGYITGDNLTVSGASASTPAPDRTAYRVGTGALVR